MRHHKSPQWIPYYGRKLVDGDYKTLNLQLGSGEELIGCSDNGMQDAVYISSEEDLKEFQDGVDRGVYKLIGFYAIS